MLTSQQAAQAEHDLNQFYAAQVCKLVAGIVGTAEGELSYSNPGTAAHNAWCLLNKWKMFEQRKLEFRRMLDDYAERAGKY